MSIIEKLLYSYMCIRRTQKKAKKRKKITGIERRRKKDRKENRFLPNQRCTRRFSSNVDEEQNTLTRNSPSIFDWMTVSFHCFSFYIEIVSIVFLSYFLYLVLLNYISGWVLNWIFVFCILCTQKIKICTFW